VAGKWGKGYGLKRLVGWMEEGVDNANARDILEQVPMVEATFTRHSGFHDNHENLRTPRGVTKIVSEME
jgi:hypothetical protein